jgi:hypothetical protein
MEIEMNAHDLTRQSISRRDFFKRAGAGLMTASLAALVPVGLVAYGDSASAQRDMWTQAAFGARVGQDFAADLGSAGKQVLKLAQVSTGPSKVQKGPNRTVPAKSGESFTLVFHGKNHGAARQGTYAFRHPQIGSFALFIVPGSADPSGQNYVAIVNRVLG